MACPGSHEWTSTDQNKSSIPPDSNPPDSLTAQGLPPCHSLLLKKDSVRTVSPARQKRYHTCQANRNSLKNRRNGKSPPRSPLLARFGAGYVNEEALHENGVMNFLGIKHDNVLSSGKKMILCTCIPFTHPTIINKTLYFQTNIAKDLTNV